MEPHDIDKLFAERLKNSAPTPPADLWNRLQERMETQLPAQLPQPEKKLVVRTLWTRSYSMAAAIALLLAAAAVFYKFRSEVPVAQPQLAQTATTAPGKAAGTAQVTPSPATATPAEAIAAGTPSAEAPKTEAAPATKATPPASALAQATPAAAPRKVTAAPAPQPVPAPVRQLAAQRPSVAPATTVTALPAETTPPVAPITIAAATPAAAADVQPVEIIFKRGISPEEAAYTAAHEEELSGFEKKQRLAKGIFRQARNLTTGEPVDLSDLGINANRIALETQIGKQKFSKVINL